MQKTDTKIKKIKKKDIILLDMDGKGYKEYRVLKINDTIAEVLGMNDLTDIEYNKMSKIGMFNTYIGHLYSKTDLDNYLNITWYNTLTEDAKNAIVQKNIIQKMYNLTDYDNYYREPNPYLFYPKKVKIKGYVDRDLYHECDTNCTYKGADRSNHSYFLKLTDYKIVGKRYVYALGIEDVAEYTGNGKMRLNTRRVRKMFWSRKCVSRAHLWLNSAEAFTKSVFQIVGYSGEFWTAASSMSFAVRPAFQIDLSKIEWRKK